MKYLFFIINYFCTDTFYCSCICFFFCIFHSRITNRSIHSRERLQLYKIAPRARCIEQTREERRCEDMGAASVKSAVGADVAESPFNWHFALFSCLSSEDGAYIERAEMSMSWPRVKETVLLRCINTDEPGVLLLALCRH